MTPLQAAKHLCARSDWSLTNLQLQKMLYIAHMLHMGETGGAHLIEDQDDAEFEAWDYGPVSYPVYRHVKAFGSEPVGNVFRATPDPGNGAQADFLAEVHDALAGWTPAQLVAFTHREGGAWDRCYQPGARRVAIPDEAILDEYRRYHA